MLVVVNMLKNIIWFDVKLIDEWKCDCVFLVYRFNKFE